MISYIIYILSIVAILGSSIAIGRLNTNIYLPFINENNVHVILIVAVAMLYVSTSYMSWVRDVDVICKERERPL